MAESLTAPIPTGSSQSAPAPILVRRGRSVHRQEPGAALLLRSALDRLDAAQTWQEVRAARERLRELGPSAVPGVLAELAGPQPPDRFDALLDVLLRGSTAEELIELATRSETGRSLRAALATALAHLAERGPAERVEAALLMLARSSETIVRYSAVEALGIAQLRSPTVLEALAEISTTDPNAAVRDEARAVLESPL